MSEPTTTEFPSITAAEQLGQDLREALKKVNDPEKGEAYAQRILHYAGIVDGDGKFVAPYEFLAGGCDDE